MKRIISLILTMTMVLSILTVLSGCSESSKNTIRIVSGSENKELEGIIQTFEKKNNIKVEMTYKGSLDIMNELSLGASEYDAVWPANSIWITMGDSQKLVKHQQSIMTTPVVFGIKKSLAEDLGFVGSQVSINDILHAIQEKKLTFAMTSATQSNSGACAYLGFLFSLLGNPDMITMDDLKNEQLAIDIQALLSGVNRSSGSSDWLKDLFLASDYDAMVNYEALIISTNLELIRQHKEPLYLVYPHDGLTIADSPLGYINHGDAKKEEIFRKFQEYLLSSDVQKQLNALGRRTGLGMTVEKPDQKVFNPDWGVDTQKILSPIRLPAADVIREALMLYQTAFRKPSATVYCVDFSGSMQGEGEKELKKAVRFILDQENASQYMLQATPKDKTIIIPFDNTIWQPYSVDGNSPEAMQELIREIEILSPRNGTDIYQPVLAGVDELMKLDLSMYSPAIVLLTDGNSNSDFTFGHFEKAFRQFDVDIPVFSITFGNASKDQLQEIAELTNARVFDGTRDLSSAFKQAKGYN